MPNSSRDRMRLYRARQRAGCVVLRAEADAQIFDALVRAGFLDADTFDQASFDRAASLALKSWAMQIKQKA